MFTKKNGLILGAFLLLCMLVGTFFDYQISEMLFDPQSFFGMLFASYGQLPAMLCFSVSGLLLIKIKKAEWLSSLLCISGFVVCTSFAVLGITLDPMLYIPNMPLSVSILIAVCIVLLTDGLIWKYSASADRKQIKVFILILLGTILTEIILINIIKIPWARPRMRMLAVQPQAAFQPWWVIGSEMKDHLLALGVAAEEFKSFPSGHSGNAACAMLLCVLPLICQKCHGKETALFMVGVVFMLIVAFSRIIMGAHFLSDVTVGMSITFIIENIFVYVFIKRNKQLKW